MSKSRLNRSFALLERAVALTLRLVDQAGENKGRVGTLRDRLQRAQADLDAHRKSQPFDKLRSRQKATEVLALTVECLSEIIAELGKGA